MKCKATFSDNGEELEDKDRPLHMALFDVEQYSEGYPRIYIESRYIDKVSISCVLVACKVISSIVNVQLSPIIIGHNYHRQLFFKDQLFLGHENYF